MAIALAYVLLLSITGCQPHRCTVDPPDRVISAPPALASALRERVARALEGPDRVILVIGEEELTALLRQALADAPTRTLTLHITDEALYLQVTIGSDGHRINAALIPAAEDGRLTMRVSCLTVNGSALPRLAGAIVESVVSALTADAAWSLYLERVTLREGTLVLMIDPDVTPNATL
jgi:hypothetical protein